MTLGARPQGFDYAASLARRFPNGHMIEMFAVGECPGSERRKYMVAEGVALIQITGTLVHSASWYDESTYRSIVSEVEQAVNDSEVRSILLRVDSPGGEVNGAFEAADRLAAAGKKKRMIAVADSMAYSAAYLMASTASEIWVPRVSGGVGSIGVYSIHRDMSGALEKAGVKVTLMSAGDGKTDGNPFEPLPDDVRKKMQAGVERMYGEFAGAVASRRNMSADDVRAIGASLKAGADAVSARLADKIGSLEDAWVALATESSAPTMVFSAAGAANSTKEANMADQQEQAAAVASAVETARSAGYSAATEIAELCAIAGKPAMTMGFLAANTSVADVRRALIDARAKDQEATEIQSAKLPLQSAANPLLAAVDKIIAQGKVA